MKIQELDVVKTHLPKLLDKTHWELKKLNGQFSLSLDPKNFEIIALGNGHVLIIPNCDTLKQIEIIKIKNFKRATELAMLTFDWGIIESIEPETCTIRIFIPPKIAVN